ncbi:hypothetical protein D3OALGA1CA_2530 [Olavius algarvensis associated proteobacterium Delta 3]|nr:hypothetical protein D3OALGA1CA_2530 [Olavius algarvensis associated proteobacterium Delta 3]CAB5137295.1 hypothetical protein D3OALGB2SA_4010 [Olavius algarvensis associated proteobacterium Delta 3]
MEIVDNIALISINETMLVQLASFLIFLFIINRIMFRPLRKTMMEREEYIDGLKTEIVEADRSLDDVKQQIEASESAVRQEAFRMRESLMDDANAQADGIFDSARKNIDEQRAEAEGYVKDQLAEAQKHLEAESRTLAASIMEKVLGRRIAA